MPSRPASRHRVLAATVGLLLAAVLVLLAEGVTSLWTGRSLLRRAIDPSVHLLRPLDDLQRQRRANTTAGPFDLDVDPGVGHRTKSGSSYAWNGVAAHTDAFGMRVRPGGWPEDGRPRWVVLGDSVAFGLGVADDATYAARLEANLAAQWRGDGPSPAVLTVASPGWNLASSTRWLADHLDRYAPSLVMLMPVHNDLDSAFVVDAAGSPATGIDPVHGLQRIHATTESWLELYWNVGSRAALPLATAVFEAGGRDAVDHVLRTGLAPESRRRWREAVTAIVALQQRLQARGAALLVLHGWDQPFERELDARLRAAAPALAQGVLFDHWRPEDALPDDGHPNPACIDAGACRALQLLDAAGLLPRGSGATALELPAAYAARTVDRLDDAALAAARDARRTALERFCGPTIRLADATGFQQIYAGVAPDGTVGIHARVALRGSGKERALRLDVQGPVAAPAPAALRIGCAFADEPERPDGEPVWIDAPLRETLAAAGGVATLRVPLPEGLDTRGWVDVQLRSSDHAVETVDGRSRVAAFRLVAIGLVE